MNFRTIQEARMEPDLYAGNLCDEVRPRWMSYDEKEGQTEIDGNIELDPSTFPPGTRILIQVPECPECGLNAEFATSGKCDCGFNWNAWRDNQYS